MLARHMLIVEKELELLLYLNYLVFCFGFQLEPKDINLNKLYSQKCDSTVPAVVDCAATSQMPRILGTNYLTL